MALIPVRYLYCQSEHVRKGGKTATGNQRSRCPTPACSPQSFLLASAYKGRSPQSKQQGRELSLTGRGVRDPARVLGISPTTVIQELKKKSPLSPRSAASAGAPPPTAAIQCRFADSECFPYL
jgi:transposase-like protein